MSQQKHITMPRQKEKSGVLAENESDAKLKMSKESRVPTTIGNQGPKNGSIVRTKLVQDRSSMKDRSPS